MIALTKSLSKEVATKNIMVNAVAPAAAKTAIFDQMSEAHIAYMLGKIPMGRFVEVQEIAAMIAWLGAARIARGRKVAAHVQALVVPGSGLVKEQAEQYHREEGVKALEGVRKMLDAAPSVVPKLVPRPVVVASTMM